MCDRPGTRRVPEAYHVRMDDLSVSLDTRAVKDHPDDVLLQIWRLTSNAIRSLHLTDSADSTAVRANLERQAASVGHELTRRNRI